AGTSARRGQQAGPLWLQGRQRRERTTRLPRTGRSRAPRKTRTRTPTGASGRAGGCVSVCRSPLASYPLLAVRADTLDATEVLVRAANIRAGLERDGSSRLAISGSNENGGLLALPHGFPVLRGNGRGRLRTLPSPFPRCRCRFCCTG